LLELPQCIILRPGFSRFGDIMKIMNNARPFAATSLLCLLSSFGDAANAADKPHLYQTPTLSKDLIAFVYAGDLWTVTREGGRAVRLTNGVGLETSPVFSPDGKTIAFTGDYDGNIDVFTVPAAGGVPKRITYHPGADIAIGWTADGKRILFRSTRESPSWYTQLFSVPMEGGVASKLPLPMAYRGSLSADGSHIAYSPDVPASGFDNTSFISWGNYHGGRTGIIKITSLPGLESVEIPHQRSSDSFPVYCGKDVYFLSARAGRVGIFRYDPGTAAVAEVLHNEGPDIRSLAAEGNILAYDQLGEIHLFDTVSGKSRLVPIEIATDLPEVRPSIADVSGEIDNVSISPTGQRVAVQAHGEILTVPVQAGPTRNITNTAGVMEREPAWSPDGQSIAYFSDESGLYALHVASQTGSLQTGAPKVKKFPLAREPAYYFAPKWSPDSRRIAFHDNRQITYVLDTVTGKLSVIDQNAFSYVSDESYDLSWSPDSKWLAYPRYLASHLHALFLYSVESGKSTQITDQMVESRWPAFDRSGKYLYFTASSNAGASAFGLDMTSSLYQPRYNLYAIVLAANQASPVAPQLHDEQAAASGVDAAPESANKAKSPARAAPGVTVAAIRVDLDGIAVRVVALPLPLGVYTGLIGGLHGGLYFLAQSEADRIANTGSTLSRWTLDDGKTEKLAERVDHFELSADGEKMLLALSTRNPNAPPPPPWGDGARSNWVVVSANAPLKPGDGALSLGGLQIAVDPVKEWPQMYHEAWRMQRAYFYDPNFHGTPTVADERRYEPFVASIASRSDLNYIFQEMLSAFSVGHLSGFGGTIPQGRHIAGGLLGADYVVRNNHYCLAKIYNGDQFNPHEHAPLAQPGLNLKPGDCILAVNGAELTADTDVQKPLEGTAGQAIVLRIGSANGGAVRDITVIPVASEASLRHIDWLESNQRKVDQLSSGKLAYVYLPNTWVEGFTNFNRYYFAQTQKQGAIIDERYNRGGLSADYIIEVLGRRLQSYWAPRYGSIERTPNAAIFGPKVMIADQMSSSGGDAIAWMFKQAKLGTLVGKRTWGGLVGISVPPGLMDGGHIFSPGLAFFTPKGEWDVENNGVEPDVVVEQDPKAVSEGHDPQLETAVAIALKDLAAHPIPQPVRPAYPNYHP
jgi:tricorn protease